jgi:hypothetical protein
LPQLLGASDRTPLQIGLFPLRLLPELRGLLLSVQWADFLLQKKFIERCGSLILKSFQDFAPGAIY